MLSALNRIFYPHFFVSMYDNGLLLFENFSTHSKLWYQQAVSQSAAKGRCGPQSAARSTGASVCGMKYWGPRLRSAARSTGAPDCRLRHETPLYPLLSGREYLETLIMTKSLLGIPRSDELPPLSEPQESSKDESLESQMWKVVRTEVEELGY